MNVSFSSSFKPSVSTVSVGRTSTLQVNYNVPEMDYSDDVVMDYSDDVNAGSISIFQNTVKFLDNLKIGNKGLGSFIVDKGINAGLWAGTKGAIEGALFGEGFLKIAGGISVATPIFEAVYKPLLKILSNEILGKEQNWFELGSVSASGFTKAITSGFFKNKEVFETFFSKLVFPGATPKTIKALLDLLKTDDYIEGFIDSTLFKSVAFDLAAGIGVDYTASLLANFTKMCVADWEDGILFDDCSWSKMAFGSTLLKSSTKLICGKAGELLGGKPGKLVGTVIGAMIGEFQVGIFTDENGNVAEGWCAAAGALEIAGAVIGVAVVIFSPIGITAGAIAAGMLIGAAIGYVAVAVTYHFDTVVSILSNIGSGAVEFFEGAGEAISDFVGDIGESVKANSVTNFLIGWAF